MRGFRISWIAAVFYITALSAEGMGMQSDETEKLLEEIQAFVRVNEQLASSGIVLDGQFERIRDAGFTHVISLLPGDQSHEDSVLTALGMGFTNIKVDWGKPTLRNLRVYIKTMEEYKDEKVFLHCQSNLRASAFMFLYRVTQLGEDKMQARILMDSIWYPTNAWHRFITQGLQEYGYDPEYRFEPEFVRMVRDQGASYVHNELREGDLDIADVELNMLDLQRVGDEYAGDREMEKAIEVYTLNALIFPDAYEVHEKLAISYARVDEDERSRGAWLGALERNPDYIWAKRQLGMLGMEEYRVFWDGLGVDLAVAENFAGNYDMGEARLEFYFEDSKFYVRPSRGNSGYELYADPENRFFVHHTNWMFEFSEKEPGALRFILSNRVIEGRKTGD